MKELEVRRLLDEHGLSWQDFAEWMIGQTLSSDSTGETVYYTDDVRSFIYHKGTGKTPINFD